MKITVNIPKGTKIDDIIVNVNNGTAYETCVDCGNMFPEDEVMFEEAPQCPDCYEAWEQKNHGIGIEVTEVREFTKEEYEEYASNNPTASYDTMEPDWEYELKAEAEERRREIEG